MNWIRGVLAVVVVGVMGTATNAYACHVTGCVVCASTGDAVLNPVVDIENLQASFPATVTGNCFTDDIYGGTYDLVIAIPGDGTATFPNAVTCSYTGQEIPLGDIQVSCGQPPPPPTTADCSPGYYKNHPDTWCTQCGFSTAADPLCSGMVADLGAKGSGSAEIRDAVKAQIDACFVTAAASPCLDD